MSDYESASAHERLDTRQTPAHNPQYVQQVIHKRAIAGLLGAQRAVCRNQIGLSSDVTDRQHQTGPRRHSLEGLFTAEATEPEIRRRRCHDGLSGRRRTANRQPSPGRICSTRILQELRRFTGGRVGSAGKKTRVGRAGCPSRAVRASLRSPFPAARSETVFAGSAGREIFQEPLPRRSRWQR
jgi:hypothetical protein